MERMIVVAAVLPVFGLTLYVISVPLLRWGRAALTPDRVAPLLYVSVLAAVGGYAVASTSGQAAELGLAELTLAGSPAALAVPAMLLAGLAGGVVAYLWELWFASRGLARAQPHRPAGEGSALQAVRSWLPSRFGFLAIGVLTALLEELLFRGYLLQGLRAELWLGLALVLQAALFGVTHAPFGFRHVLAKSVTGLVWGLLVVAFATVLVAVLAHLSFQVLAGRRLWRQAARSIPGGDPVAHRAEPA